MLKIIRVILVDYLLPIKKELLKKTSTGLFYINK